MNTSDLLRELAGVYPGKSIISLPEGENDAQEVIVELEPTHEHLNWSKALVVVGKSAAHYHKVSTEIYEALEGELTVYVDDVEHVLKPGQSLTINPGQIHSAEGQNARFLTHSKPGWTIEDHFLV